MIWPAFLLSLKVTALASCLILVLGLALGTWLAQSALPGSLLVSTFLNLPLVLPPSVVGYGLLLLLGQSGPLQRWLGLELLFTWQAGAIASTVVALPLMIESTRAALSGVNPELKEVARTLGASEVEVWWQITLPLAYRGILAGFSLSVARGFGEFGATLMVAANMPGRTQTLPLAIYDAVQLEQFSAANTMVLLVTAIAFTLVGWVRYLESRRDY